MGGDTKSMIALSVEYQYIKMGNNVKRNNFLQGATKHS